MTALLCTSIGYIFGCFQSAFIFVRLFKKCDIRKTGTGNPGTANVLISFGALPAALVLVFDMLKGAAASLLCLSLFRSADRPEILSFCFLGTALGHNFPFWLKFRGGKGVSVACSFALILDLRIFIIALLTAGVFALLRRSAVYAAYTFALMMFVCAADFGYSEAVMLSAAAQSAMIVILHLIRRKKHAEITPQTQ